MYCWLRGGLVKAKKYLLNRKNVNVVIYITREQLKMLKDKEES